MLIKNLNGIEQICSFEISLFQGFSLDNASVLSIVSTFNGFASQF